MAERGRWCEQADMWTSKDAHVMATSRPPQPTPAWQHRMIQLVRGTLTSKTSCMLHGAAAASPHWHSTWTDHKGHTQLYAKCVCAEQEVLQVHAHHNSTGQTPQPHTRSVNHPWYTGDAVASSCLWLHLPLQLAQLPSPLQPCGVCPNPTLSRTSILSPSISLLRRSRMRFWLLRLISRRRLTRSSSLTSSLLVPVVSVAAAAAAAALAAAITATRLELAGFPKLLAKLEACCRSSRCLLRSALKCCWLCCCCCSRSSCSCALPSCGCALNDPAESLSPTTPAAAAAAAARCAAVAAGGR